MLNTTPARMLSEIVQNGPDHRAALARTLGVSRTAISNAVQGLESAGLVEVPVRAEDRLTLKDAVRLTRDFGVAGSVVMASGSVSVGVGTFDGGLLAQRTTTIDAETGGSERLVLAVEGIAEAMGSAAPDAQLRAVHLAVNTQSDRRTGEVLGGLASRQWSGVNPKVELEHALGTSVSVENTARLLALTERIHRSERAAEDLVYVHLSRGISLGHVVDGVIIPGVRGGAGEFGHLSIDRDGLPCECGSRGCLMQYAGSRVLAASAQRILGPEAGAQDLYEAAARDGGEARDAVVAAARAVGTALAGICNLLGPGMVVIGGDLLPAEDLVLETIAEEVRERALPMAGDSLEIVGARASRGAAAVLEAGLGSLRWDPEVRERAVEEALGTVG